MIKIIYNEKLNKFIEKNKKIIEIFNKKFYKLALEIINNNYKIEKLITNLDIKKMKGSEWQNFYRLRHSNYRAIFKYEQKELKILIFKISHRGNIYKN